MKLAASMPVDPTLPRAVVTSELLTRAHEIAAAHGVRVDESTATLEMLPPISDDVSGIPPGMVLARLSVEANH